MSIRPVLVALSIVLTPIFSLSTLAQQASNSRYIPTPPPMTADPTLEPIAADEPVPPAGFPPLPDRLNLGTSIASADANNPHRSGSAPSAPGRPVQPTYHQGYGHLPAGAFQQSGQSASNSSGYGHAAAGAFRQPASSGGQESYNTNTPNGSLPNRAPGGQQTASQPQLPNLPAPVTVSQSTTQDLSLPDDEFTSNRPPKRNNTGMYAGSMLRSYMMGAAGMGMGMGMGALRY